MGLNTPALILNDMVHELEANGTAGAAIAHHVRTGEGGNTAIGVKVGKPMHSSGMQVVAFGGNTMRTLGYGSCGDCDEALLRKLADRLGFTLRRKPSIPETP